VLFSRNSLPTLDFRSLGAVENKEWEERYAYKPCTTKEQSPQFRILAFSSICSMKEPDRRINANAETPKMGRIPFEAIHDSEMAERS
jgi:hypothetical protein